MDLKCCCDPSSSLKQTHWPMSVSWQIACCTDFVKLDKKQWKLDNPALLVSWVPVVRLSLNHLYSRPPS